MHSENCISFEKNHSSPLTKLQLRNEFVFWRESKNLSNRKRYYVCVQIKFNDFIPTVKMKGALISFVNKCLNIFLYNEHNWFSSSSCAQICFDKPQSQVPWYSFNYSSAMSERTSVWLNGQALWSTKADSQNKIAKV